jgi:hypothetical protein
MCFLEKVQITIVIMPKIFFGTNDISLALFLATFWVIFAALCLQTVLSAGSDKGRKKLELPPWKKWRTGRLFQRGISSEQMLW